MGGPTVWVVKGEAGKGLERRDWVLRAFADEATGREWTRWANATAAEAFRAAHAPNLPQGEPEAIELRMLRMLGDEEFQAVDFKTRYSLVPAPLEP